MKEHVPNRSIDLRREQRDEWCIQLQALMSIKTTPNQHAYQQLQPYRMRTKTDAASNRPAASRARRGAPTTAPGSMLGIFQDELVKVVKVSPSVVNPGQKSTAEGEDAFCFRQERTSEEML